MRISSIIGSCAVVLTPVCVFAAESAGKKTTEAIVPLIMVGIIALVGYFIPTIVAYNRKKLNKMSILLLNFFLGWSLIGWVVALVWATAKDKQ